MSTRALDCPVFDADNHLYETKDALTKYLPDRYKSAVDYVDVRGRKKIVIRGQISDYIPNPTFEVVARPGAQEDYYRHGNPEGKSRREIFGQPMKAIPAFSEAAPRLEHMDEQVVERGARAVLIRPAPVPGYKGRRSFALPEFDPFWEKVVEHDVLVCLHSSDSGYDRYTNEWSGEGNEMLPFQIDAFHMYVNWRPVEDAVASLVAHGALSRFPRLKIAIVENGS